MVKPRGKDAATTIEQAELALIERAAPWLRKPAVQALAAIGKIGDQPPLLALSGAVMAAGLLRRDVKLARTGARMTLAHVLATAAKTVGKNNLDRTRPREHLEHGNYRMERGRSHDPALRSFPSGHTAGAVALGRAVAREYPNHAVAAQAAAGAIGVLQVPRRAHFPTDVLAGAVIGLAAEALVAGAVTLAWRAKDAVDARR
ncbi:phosphatase PAP2 family protein [uncultured Sphingomonas sp.]|uniref:phosphatase PAP2 family protein n=1 Tax=uncultured Sphingomonas sp. TaxID=158754 RepID=UPI0025D94205|nr:phosphatase PAP2 family protein [uncultured Sphingomonas sp.]